MALPQSENLDLLKQPLTVGNTTFENRLVIQPMEGCDGTYEGSPSELTQKRYDHFAKSQAALIWFEAVSVQQDGRANPRQLFLHEKNLGEYQSIIANMKETAQKTTGVVPKIIMQATHSGRYAKPEGKPKPIIAYNNPLFEGQEPLPKECIISDDALKQIEENYAKTTDLAMKAGFDGIDIKCCHRYLNSELLSAFNRPGAYGGSLENRSRFYKNAVAQVRSRANPDFVVTSRLNIYDGFPYPYGFGVGTNGGIEPNLTEPLQLIETMGFDLLNITMGNPYVNPEVNRPTDPKGVELVYELTKQVQDHFKHIAIVSSAPSCLKSKSQQLAAGAIEQGYCKLVGFGRMAFAYPNFAKDMLANQFDNKQACIACAKCSKLMRAGSVTGCVVRDPYYTKLYREVFSL